jgi:hypothetical protein
MPDPLDLAAVARVRRATAEASTELSDVTAAIAAARAAADEARRAGSEREAGTAERRAADLADRARALDEALRGHAAELAELSDAAVAVLQPEAMVATLAAALPIVLLPVRLEARFFTSPPELRVRIFPDQLHIEQHEAELTADERAAGVQYWTARWSASDAGAAAWAVLCAALGPGRAAWVADRLTPTNAAAAGTRAAPAFPDVPLRPSTWSRAARAVALPDRWAVVGITGGAQVFRKWGGAVPDALAASLSPVDRPDAADAGDDLFAPDDEARWLVDFAAAEQVGMAVRIGASDLAPGFALSQGLDQLVVVGVDWTRTPEDSAEALASLLDAHAVSDGLSYLPIGTPTNTTDATPADAAPAGAVLALALDPARTPDPAALAAGAATRLVRAAGLGERSRFGARVPGATLREPETDAHMANVLWESTIGYYAQQFLAPILDDAAVGRLRQHVVRYLLPSSPVATLRIGRQPYGILPVVASALFRPTDGQPIEAELAAVLSRARPLWDNAAATRAPRLGRTADPDADLLQVLQTTPLSGRLRFRYVMGPLALQNLKGNEARARVQGLTAELAATIIGAPARPQIADYFADLQSHPLDVPLVEPAATDGAAGLTRNYLRELAGLVRTSGTTEIGGREDADTLLESLVAHSAARELHVAEKLVVDHYRLSEGLIATAPVRALMPTAELLGIETPAPAAGEIVVTTPGELSRLVVPRLTGTRTLREYLVDRLGERRPDPEVGRLHEFLLSLEALATRSVAELEVALRAVLDACSHRLDAWYTSLATRRLLLQRAATPTGVHLGGFGWLDDLRPERAPDSLGYVHAPSLDHAATAAVLRSGHLAHRDAAHEALEVTLTSERVRLATGLLEGVANGQPLAALLGYRFERGLRERDIRLARYIFPLRQLAPLRESGAPPAPGVSLEAIAARDVVDGVALLEQWRERRQELVEFLDRAGTSRGDIEAELARTADLYDAVSDLLVSEAVHQTVLGNTTRAGSALAVLDRQERGEVPAVAGTRRTGLHFTHRVLVLCTDERAPAGWRIDDPRARAEPRLNAWIGRLLGNPSRIVVAASRSDAPGTAMALPIAKLKLSPLSLVMAAKAGSPSEPSELQQRLVAAFATQVGTPAPGTVLTLAKEPHPSAGADGIGLGALQVMLEWIHDLVTDRRPLEARDLASPDDQLAEGWDPDELKRRADGAVTAYRSARTALNAALRPRSPPAARLSAALAGASAFGVRDALVAGTDDVDALAAAARATLRAMDAALERLSRADAAFEDRRAAGEVPAKDAALHHTVRLRLLFGDGFPVLPTLEAPRSDELAASLAARATLTRDDDLAPRAWLGRMALVRPETDALVRLLGAAELTGGTEAGDVALMQVPHAPGEPWVALPFGETPPRAHCAIVAHWSGTADPARTLAGLFVDAWPETVPSATEVTGISFHYDAPGARAPQAVLLAVSPAAAEAAWTFDALLETVREAYRLGRIRAVGPRELELLGPVLPATYLPESYSKDVPSVHLTDLVTKYRAAGVITAIAGKE